MAAAATSPTPAKAEKKHKRDKKRAREEDAAAAPDAERKPKKSKSVSTDLKLEDGGDEPKPKRKKDRDRKSKAGAADDAPPAAPDVEAASKEDGKRKKRDNRKKHADREGEAQASSPVVADDGTPQKKHKKKKTTDAAAAPDQVGESSRRKKSKKDKDKKTRSKKHADDTASEAAAQKTPRRTAPADADAMDVDQAAPSVYQPPDMPARPQFPFFSQTVSLYEPLYPNGWAQPVTNAKYQHLQHLQNRYVPALRGVLLDYRNVALGPAPGRGHGAASDDDAPTTLMSRGEYAVGFGWITADVELFIPSRGAWMEGSVNLQTEGHIGVVCFGKFNASIEARRLPPDWKWVSSESSDAQGFDETASVMTADDHGVVRQIHSTGFWVDGSGARVKGRTRFRIRNFDAGTSGDASYLSLEGTMLDKESEKRLVRDEARAAQERRPGRGGQNALRQRAPDFSLTRFEAEEEAEEARQQGGGEAGAADEAEPEAGGESEEGAGAKASMEDS